MTLKEHIKEEVMKHMIKHSIHCSDKLLSYIINSVSSGTCAFQLIYIPLPSLLKKVNSNVIVKEVKPLNYQDIRIKTTKFGKLYSYDSGVRFQWGESETLIIDIQKIRHQKILDILD